MCGFTLSQNLPTDGFKFVETININQYFIKDYDGKNEIVFYLKTDLKYRKQLARLCNKLPFLPEKMVVNKLFVTLMTKKIMWLILKFCNKL